MAYKEEKVSIQKLFKSGQVKSFSKRALRSRAREGLLIYADYKTRPQLYDKQLSIIVENAAYTFTGVNWTRIRLAKEAAEITKEFLIEQLNQGLNDDEVTEKVVQRIERKLTKTV